jgi:hypothetical protein
MPISKEKLKQKLIHAATLSLIAAGMIGCSAGEGGPFDPYTLGENDRLASRDVRTYKMPPLPTTLQSPYLEETPQPTSPPQLGPSLGPSRRFG